MPNPTDSTFAPDDDAAQLRAGATATGLTLEELLAAAAPLTAGGRLAEAAGLYTGWLEAGPSRHGHVAWFNLGTLLVPLGRLGEAEQAYRAALAAAPTFLQARINLGHVLEQQGRADDALAAWQAVEDMPGVDRSPLALRLHALNNGARLLERLGRLETAEARLRASLLLEGAQPDVVRHYVHLRQRQCRWPLHQPVGDVDVAQLVAGTPPMAMLAATDDPVLQRHAAQRHVQDHVPAWTGPPLHRGTPSRSGRIRIGYLSGDLRLHPVGLLAAELLELHDRSRFEVYGFCWSREDGSPLRQRLLAALNHHVPLAHLDDQAAAQSIADLGIDVLVDLQGLTEGARPAILGRRPAPVQVAYLGYPGTSAVPGVDWVIADPWVMPPASTAFYSERPLYLPSGFQVSDRRREEGAVTTRRACGLPEQGFVFCAFNNSFKITEAVFRRWMRILGQVPGSVLWLLAEEGEVKRNLLATAKAEGVAADRLVFASRVAPPAYLARLAVADLFLDTFPYNGGTTVNDALWMGLPVLTCSGRSFASRMAGSLLAQVGMSELVTADLFAYEQRAVTLAREPALVAELRRRLAQGARRSALFDVPARVRALESVLEREALACRDP
jgi:predicted O-linked N-acetylglucosamine transferase (SPINDLY family)